MKPAVTVLTPEHVPVEVFPAGLGSRFIALTIDAVITIAVPGFAVALLGKLLPGGIVFAVQATLALGTMFLYNLYFEVNRQGRTLGKAFVGLRVVDDRGLPLTLPQSLVRNVLRILDGLPLFYGVGAVSVMLHPERRRLGDIAARTLVIEERILSGNRPGNRAASRIDALSDPRTLRLIRQRIGLEERELVNDVMLRLETLESRQRFELLREIGSHYRAVLEIEAPTLSDENLVRSLAEVLSRPTHRARRPSPIARPG